MRWEAIPRCLRCWLGIGHRQHPQGQLGLLWNDSVAKHLQAGGWLESVPGDVAGLQPHHPFDEVGAQAWASVGAGNSGSRCGSSEDGLPAPDGGGVLAPIRATTVSMFASSGVPAPRS